MPQFVGQRSTTTASSPFISESPRKMGRVVASAGRGQLPPRPAAPEQRSTVGADPAAAAASAKWNEHWPRVLVVDGAGRPGEFRAGRAGYRMCAPGVHVTTIVRSKSRSHSGSAWAASVAAVP